MENKGNWKTYGLGLIIALVGSSLTIYLMCSSCRSEWEKFFWNAVFSTSCWVTLWSVNNWLNHYLNKKISWIQTPIKRLVVGVLATIFFTVLAVVALIRVWELAARITFNSYREVIVSSLIITFFISLFYHGRSFLLEWKRSAVEAERYQKESMAATYESLKNQVNPHFLFNTLNALTNLVYEDQDKAAKSIKQLSEVYRHVLDMRDKELVDLKEELKFLQSYLYLQQIRFGDKLKVSVELEGVKSLVPPLVLQMLLENAIKHNVIAEESPLHIRVFSADGFIHVENNLQKKTVLPDDSPGVGLANIRMRYSHVSNTPVEVIQNDKFIVRLPIVSLTL